MRYRVSTVKWLFIAVLMAGPVATACLTGYPPSIAVQLVVCAMLGVYLLAAILLRSTVILGALIGLFSVHLCTDAVPGNELGRSIVGTLFGAMMGALPWLTLKKPKNARTT